MIGKININYVLYIFLIIGLYGTLGNKIYISPIPSLIAFILFPFVVFVKNKYHIISAALLPYFVISIINIILYSPSSFLEFEFYRYDGNFFISFFPLLLFPFFKYNFDVEKLLYRFLVVSVIINSILFILGFTDFGIELNFMKHNILGRNFHGFFKAHNAAGGFFSFLTSVATVFLYKKKSIKNVIIFILCFIFLIDTGSRGSLLGYLIGIFCYILLLWKGKSLISIVFASLTLLISVILLNTYGDYMKHRFSNQQETMEYIRETKGFVGAKKMNIYHRAYGFWPRSIDGFLHSPVFGMGYGAINDVPLKFENSIGIINFNKNKKKVFDDQHGHNSYLHILSEQGIVGLTLFLFFWVIIYNFLINNKKGPATRDVLLITFLNISVMSFTEHRITTPSNALPFVILLSLYILFLNGKKHSAQ